MSRGLSYSLDIRVITLCCLVGHRLQEFLNLVVQQPRCAGRGVDQVSEPRVLAGVNRVHIRIETVRGLGYSLEKIAS